MNPHRVLDALKGGLIVSCQAVTGTALGRPEILAALAAAAQAGGAAGIRADGPANVAEIRRQTPLPLIAIYKVVRPGSDVYITPTFEDAAAVWSAADPCPEIIAIDATPRPRSDGGRWQDLLTRLHSELGVLVMADIATFEEGVAAAEAGADIVATTLSGYTAYTAERKATGEPDLALVEALSQAVDVPVICEGRVHSPEQARAALDAGAHAVVVGTAITAVDWVTRQYVAGLRG
jgi:N-acylglucosamine-6-phosphate 2-epimerase